VYILSKSPPQTGREKGEALLHLEKLGARSPVLTDLNAIELYDDALGDIFPDLSEEWSNIIGEVWLLRVKALPKDEESSKKAFQQCVLKEDFDHAQQIANILEKNFPTNHAYHLWTITTLFYYSQSLNYSESSRSMRGRLAFVLINKLAAETKKAKVDGCV
jgi:N-terminal acetyltransferase B complex non-catalytic subunit